jgi:hypothetical protein
VNEWARLAVAVSVAMLLAAGEALLAERRGRTRTAGSLIPE